MLGIAGTIVVVMVVVDILQTTIHVGGSGAVSRRLNLMIWRMWPRRNLWLPLAGPVIVMSSVLAWFLLFWLGWVLIFLSGDPAVVSDPSKEPANMVSLIYYVGFSVITLGVGDYAPNGPVWQILTIVASASGFFLVTLVITYLLPLISAVVEQRQLAAYIHSLGRSPQELLNVGWDGQAYHDLGSHLISLAPMIHRQTYLHQAYPILHYFRSGNRFSAVAPALALLDDAMTLILYRIPAEQRPPQAQLRPLRIALTELFTTLGAAFVAPAAEPPPGDRTAFSTKLNERRCLLLGWLQDQGWQWHPLAEEAERDPIE